MKRMIAIIGLFIYCSFARTPSTCSHALEFEITEDDITTNKTFVLDYNNYYSTEGNCGEPLATISSDIGYYIKFTNKADSDVIFTVDSTYEAFVEVYTSCDDECVSRTDMHIPVTIFKQTVTYVRVLLIVENAIENYYVDNGRALFTIIPVYEVDNPYEMNVINGNVNFISLTKEMEGKCPNKARKFISYYRIQQERDWNVMISTCNSPIYNVNYDVYVANENQCVNVTKKQCPNSSIMYYIVPLQKNESYTFQFTSNNSEGDYNEGLIAPTISYIEQQVTCLQLQKEMYQIKKYTVNDTLTLYKETKLSFDHCTNETTRPVFISFTSQKSKHIEIQLDSPVEMQMTVFSSCTNEGSADSCMNSSTFNYSSDVTVDVELNKEYFVRISTMEDITNDVKFSIEMIPIMNYTTLSVLRIIAVCTVVLIVFIGFSVMLVLTLVRYIKSRKSSGYSSLN